MGGGSNDRCGNPRRPGPDPSISQARGARVGDLLSRQGSHGADVEAQRIVGITIVRRLVEGRATRYRRASPFRRRTTKGLDHFDCPPVRRGTAVCAHHPAQPSGVVDAQAVRNLEPTRSSLYRRSVRIRSAHRSAANQKADPHPPQAGAGIRCGSRTGHPKPRRCRLQGPVQRRHVDDRSVTDRTRP